MNTAWHYIWDVSYIHDKVAHLPQKVTLIDVPGISISTLNVNIRGEHTKSDKGARCKDYGSIIGLHTVRRKFSYQVRKEETHISEQLGIVEHHNRSADKIDSWREVHQCPHNTRGVAGLPTTIAVGYCTTDRGCVVGLPISFRSIVSDISKNLLESAKPSVKYSMTNRRTL